MDRVTLQDSGSPLQLRPTGPDDGLAIYEAAAESIEHVSPWMGWLTPAYRKQDAIDWAKSAVSKWNQGECYEFVMIDPYSNRLCGCCGLNQIDHENLVCNLGYWVRASERQRGLATASVRMLKNFGFEQLKLRRIEIVAATGNLPSCGVAEKSGAHFEGVQRSRLKVGETSHDARMYALVSGGD